MKIGIIGAGQLGQMLALAGLPFPQVPFPRLERGCARRAGGADRRGRVRRLAALRRLAGEVDVVTYEFENVPVAALHEMAATRPCFPPVDALRVSQDRILEKELFGRLGIPTPTVPRGGFARRSRGRRCGAGPALRAQDAPTRL